MLVLSYICRAGSPLLNFLLLVLLSLFDDESLSNNILLFLSYLLLVSGWCSMSYRQKVFSQFRADNKACLPGGYITSYIFVSFWVSILFSISCFFFYVPGVSGGIPVYFLSVILGVFLYHACSVVYAFYWESGRLPVSYLIDLIPLACIVFSLLLVFFVGGELSSFLLVFFVGGLVVLCFFYHKIFRRIRFGVDIFYSWGASILVVLISTPELFFFARQGASGFLEFRWLLIGASVAITFFTVFRQYLLSKKNISFSFGWCVCSAAVVLFLCFCHYVFLSDSVVFTVFVFVVACVFQGWISFVFVDMHAGGRSVYVFVINLMTFFFVVFLFVFSPVGLSPLQILTYKFWLVCFNVVLVSLFSVFLVRKDNIGDEV